MDVIAKRKSRGDALTRMAVRHNFCVAGEGFKGVAVYYYALENASGAQIVFRMPPLDYKYYNTKYEQYVMTCNFAY